MSAEAALSDDPGIAIARRIDADGAISLHDYMDIANRHYYATRDPLGASGDFVTAPEVSQMFGEIIGLWCADLWMRAGRPADVAYVELGPGRGTLAADALRALASVGCRPPVHLVETSPVLRRAQARAVPQAVFHDHVGSMPADVPLLIVANEFFDALPIRQYLRADTGWRERVLINDGLEWGHRFFPALGTVDVAAPGAFVAAPQGTVVESCPAAVEIMHALAARIAAQGGAMIAIDYGYAGPATGDTMQAIQAHRFADPFAEPGARDLTAHVDFTALAQGAVAGGCIVPPLAEQGAFLQRLGISARAGTLAQASPDRRAELATALRRLTDPAEMGRLFKVMAATHPGWPTPEGFAA